MAFGYFHQLYLQFPLDHLTALLVAWDRDMGPEAQYLGPWHDIGLSPFLPKSLIIAFLFFIFFCKKLTCAWNIRSSSANFTLGYLGSIQFQPWKKEVHVHNLEFCWELLRLVLIHSKTSYQDFLMRSSIGEDHLQLYSLHSHWASLGCLNNSNSA